MALPGDQEIQTELLRLLSKADNGRMHCQDIYIALAEKFPRLSKDEKTIPYRNSISHWANRVQFARQHLVTKGWFLHMTASGGRGYWAISKAGKKALADMEELGMRLLAELEALP